MQSPRGNQPDMSSPPPSVGDNRLSGAFWALWSASALGDLATGSVLVAVPLLAAALTRDPVLIGGLTAATLLPWLLFGIPAGVLVDRMDRRTAMVAGNLIRAAALAALGALIVAGHADLRSLFAVAFLLGTAETVYDCAARAALISVAPVGQIDRANGLLITTHMVASDFLGGPLAGTLFAVTAALPFGLYAAAFALAAGIVLALPRLRVNADGGLDQGGPHQGTAGSISDGGTRVTRGAVAAPNPIGPRVPDRHRLRREWLEGLHLIWADGELRGLCLLSATLAVGGELAQSVTVLFALQVLHLPGQWFGLFTAAAGVGVLLGGSIANRLVRRFGRAHVLTGALAGYGASLAATGLATSAWQAAAMYALGSATVAAWNVLSMSARQVLVPGESFGRFHGAWRTIVWGSAPIGAVASGLVAAQFGLRAPWLVGGTLILLQLVFAPSLMRRIEARVDHPPLVLPRRDGPPLR